MSGSKPLNVWHRWVRHPQKIWLRKALFQVHLWSGIALGLYIFLMSVTGGVLVYRNELYRAATTEPILSKGSGPRLTDDQLAAAATQLYPGYQVVKITRAPNLDLAVNIGLRRGKQIKTRAFDPRSGSDLGDTVSSGYLLVSELLDLHDNLLAGPRHRRAGCVVEIGLRAGHRVQLHRDDPHRLRH